MSILIYPEADLNDFDKFKNPYKGSTKRTFSEMEHQEYIIFDGLHLKSIPVDDRKTNEDYKQFVEFLMILRGKFNDFEVKLNDVILTDFPKPPSMLFDNLNTADEVNIIQIRYKPGLVIHNMLIKKISGPIEIAILKPKETFFREMKVKYDVNAPIFMMFGDVHTNRNTLCSPCDATNCMFIWDDIFYKLLDKMAVDNYPIDINIEAFTFGRMLNDRDDRPIVKMIRLFNRCLKQNEAVGVESNLCPTTKLRYQYSDIRQTYQAHETVIGDLQFELFYWMICEFTDNYGNYEMDKTNVLKELQNIVDKIKNKIDILLFLDKCIGFYTDRYHSFRVKGIEDFPKSFLKKQYDKSPELKPFFDDILRRYFSERSTDSGETNILMTKYYQALKHAFTNIMNKSEFDVESLSDFARMLPLIHRIMFQNQVKFLDVYYLFRMFSKRNINLKREESNPLLSVSYFGFCHVLRLTTFLITEMYDVLYVNFDHSKGSEWDNLCSIKGNLDAEKQTAVDIKCVDFIKRVNLNDIYNYYVSLSKTISVPKKSSSDGKSNIRKSKGKKTKGKKSKGKESKGKSKGKKSKGKKSKGKSKRKSKRKKSKRKSF